VVGSGGVFGGFGGMRSTGAGTRAQPIPEPPGPGLVGWRSIGFSNEMFESGYVQERELNISGPVRRAWIMLNLRESIPIPETGGRALSVRIHWGVSLRGTAMAPAGRGLVCAPQCAAAGTCGTPAAKRVPECSAGDAWVGRFWMRHVGCEDTFSGNTCSRLIFRSSERATRETIFSGEGVRMTERWRRENPLLLGKSADPEFWRDPGA
jgi:hypothetical protein